MNLSRLLTVALVLGTAPLFATNPKPSGVEKESLKKLFGKASNITYHRDDGRVNFIRFSKSIITDDHLEPIKDFPRLEYLAIVSPQVTDAGLAHIAGSKNLETLVLSGTKVTDAGLDHVVNLKKLEHLYLDDLPITDDGLKKLAGLTSLKTLSLNRTHITDDARMTISGYTELENLALNGTAITVASLPEIQKLSKLKSVFLNHTDMRGSGLGGLSDIKMLKSVGLTAAKLDEVSMKELASLKQVRVVNLLKTDVSDESLAALRKSLSKTSVYPPPTISAPASSKQAPKRTVIATEFKEVLAPAHERFAAIKGDEVPDFQRHVVPLFGRLGCNGRSCHGSFQGQGGFRLSMFGYDFSVDHEALTKGEEPRVDVKQPASSLILNKPTSDQEHGGGKRYEKGGWEHHLLHRWIAAGAAGVSGEPRKLLRLDVTPSEVLFTKHEEQTKLNVIAVWADGTREDVTGLTRFQSNDDGVVSVDQDGELTNTGAGDTYVIAFYDNGIAAIPVIRPVSERTGDKFPRVPTPTEIDRHVINKLAKLGVVPSELCTDEEFLRRVSLDIIGTLPTPSEIKKFTADPSADKRKRKIDELLERSAYTTWWSTLLCDLTGANAGYLGSTEMASVVAGQWQSWMIRRVKENVGWDEIAAGMILATSREPGQPYEEYIVEESKFTGRKPEKDYAALDNTMPHYWYRSNIGLPKDKALSFGYIFMGVRLQCAECHKHPFDQWSKQDFQDFTKFFTRIKSGISPDALYAQGMYKTRLGVPAKLNTAALRRQSYLRIAAEGKAIPWNEIYIEPPKGKPVMAKLLGGDTLDLNQHPDPRVPLMEWLRTDKNRYFAKSFVNRIWAHYFNVGIIDPPDDLNLANPPSNRPLLDALTTGFIASGYDMKWLHRTITSSRTYQLSYRPTETNRGDKRNFSHAIVRRLPAEVVVDAIQQATVNDRGLAKVNFVSQNRMIGNHPRSYQARVLTYALSVFGKPLRSTNCDCERQNEPTLLQSLYVRNDKEIFDAIARADSWVTQIQLNGKKRPKAEPPAAEELIRTAYLRTLSRQPTAGEIKDGEDFFSTAEDRLDGLRDLMWALLNSQEFITNH